MSRARAVFADCERIALAVAGVAGADVKRQLTNDDGIGGVNRNAAVGVTHVRKGRHLLKKALTGQFWVSSGSRFLNWSMLLAAICTFRYWYISVPLCGLVLVGVFVRGYNLKRLKARPTGQ